MTAVPTQDQQIADSSWKTTCDEAIASIKNINLPNNLQIPALPTALTRFLTASTDPEYRIGELAKIVENDPGLMLELLRFVNSAAKCRSRKIRTASDALLRIGVPTARRLLLAVGVRAATMGHKSRLMNSQHFRDESLQKAVFARRVAKRFGMDEGLAYIGGLLQDYLLPVLTNAFDNDYVEFVQDDSPNREALHVWEEARFGWNHASAGAAVALRWDLPEDLLRAIFLHHEMDLPLLSPQGDVFDLFPITLAALLPDQLNQSPTGLQRLIHVDATSNVLRFDDLCRLVDEEVGECSAHSPVTNGLVPAVQNVREMLDRS